MYEKEIVYPIFLECCKFCPDLFWTNIFEELTYGKCPYGVYISKDFLCCNYKNKEFSYKIEVKEPCKIYEEVYGLFSGKLGLMSYHEKLQKRLDFNNTESSIKDLRQTWNAIRKKTVKELLIEKYVINMKKKHSLTYKQSKYLLSLIFIAIVFKVITQKDIIYNDNKIQHIEGIDFKKKKIIFNKNLYTIEASFAPQIIIDRKSMSDSWEKYLKDLRKVA